MKLGTLITTMSLLIFSLTIQSHAGAVVPHTDEYYAIMGRYIRLAESSSREDKETLLRGVRHRSAEGS